jgi:hypothetical protein
MQAGLSGGCSAPEASGAAAAICAKPMSKAAVRSVRITVAELTGALLL